MQSSETTLFRRAALALLAAAAFAVGLWPSWAVRDRVLTHFDNPPYEGVWILIPHALLYSTLAALFCVIVWVLLARARWIEAPRFALNGGVVLWGVAGGLISVGLTVGALFAMGQAGAFHAPSVDPWLMGANAFSNFFEEFIFRGFILIALTAAFGFWPAAILSSIGFAAMHSQYPLPLQALIGMMGLLWCLVTVRAKSLLSPYIAHTLLDWLIDPFL